MLKLSHNRMNRMNKTGRCPDCESLFCRCKNKKMNDYSYYLKIEKIGEANNAVAFNCINLITQQEVAMKIMRFENEEEGVPSTAILEISKLRELKHPNIVSLMKVTIQNKLLYLLYEYLPMNLENYMETLPHGQPIETQLVKNYLHQITRGIDYCHKRGIIHRDLKPQNVLIDNKGVIKLADFRSVRDLDMRAYTLGVVTQWYRAPELLLRSTSDSFAVDIWSIGCIFAEMTTRRPLFQGDSDSQIDQIIKIFSVMSTPTEETWPGFSDLPGYKSSFPTFPDNLKDSVNELDPLGFDLLQKMLVYLPSQRINAQSILKHPYFDDLDKSLLPGPVID